MFTPKYSLTHQLLNNITQVYKLITELNHYRFPRTVLVRFERVARELSVHASTSIEGNPLSLTAVKQLLKSHPKNLHFSQQEVVNYNQALQKLRQSKLNKKSPLSLHLILQVHKMVTQSLLPKYQSGKLRTFPVVVNNPKTGRVVFLPPDAKEVRELLLDLVSYINHNQQKIDPVILSGILHKQLVLIHPFMDGNGRTTRLITKVVLAQMGLDTFNLFSFENYYNHNVSAYFQHVGEFGDYHELLDKIDFTAWLEYFSKGLVTELERVKQALANVSHTVGRPLLPQQRQILQYIQRHGSIADRDYAKLTDRARATRALDFRQLIQLGLIKRLGAGKSSYYVFAGE